MCLLNEGVLLAQVELQADQYPAGCPIRGCSIDVRGAESAAAITRVTECPGLHQPQDDHALTLVDDGVDDQPGAAAVGGGPLVGELVVALAGLVRFSSSCSIRALI